MTPAIHEIFDKFDRATTKEARITVLRTYANPTFIQFLQKVFDENVKFYTNKFPDLYKEPENMMPGIEYSTIHQELKRTYLFEVDNPAGQALPIEKRNLLLTQILESLHPREADFFVRMMAKNLKVKYLTPNLIKEALPGILS